MRRLALLLFASTAAWACPEPPPVSERPPDIVPLRAVAPDIAQDIRYAGRDNFVGAPIEAYATAQCLLTRPAALALARAQVTLKKQGWALKVYDCYRPQRAVAHFVRWAADPDEATRERYYPRLTKPKLLEEVYIAVCSGHSRASTVDVGLVPLRASLRKTVPRMHSPDCGATDPQAADMGTGFDCFDLRSHTDSSSVRAAQRKRRWLLRSAMEAAGFKNYEKEWWHYSLVNEPYPQTYFDFPVR